MNIQKLYNDIQKTQSDLELHPVYAALKDQEALRIFMENHVFAVWDFMTLLKALQIKTTCVSLPWRPSKYHKKLVRIINELVLAEESDIDHLGLNKDHFTIYCNAMAEVGADINKIMYFMTSLDYKDLSLAQESFVKYNLNLALTGSISQIAGAFFFGREKIIPGIFKHFLEGLRNYSNVESELRSRYPSLIYYFERHIDVDGNEHKFLAENFLDLLCTDDEMKEQAYQAGLDSLHLRRKLWDSTLSEIKGS